MAVNKRKVLDAARKFAQKGAKQKALKEYNTLLKLDPRDAKLHLEIGDAHRRWGEIDEAIAQYMRVAQQYKDDGFDARAVAVFKQVLNLDPKRYDAYVSLSELYQRIGLDSEASAALQTAADGYHKEGKKREALDLLRRMAALDPSNTTNRMKVAELLRQEGMDDEAVTEYEEVASELSRQGANEQICGIYERILEIQPKRIDMLVSVANVLVEAGQAARAEGFAQRAQSQAPDDTDHHELLIQIYQSLGREDEVARVTRELANVYKERGDDEKSRQLLQRLPADDALSASDAGIDLGAPQVIEETPEIGTEDDLLIDDDLIGDDGFLDFDSDGPSLDLGDASEPELSLDGEVSGGDVEAAEVGGAADADVDVDQLLAEASVYLRYGKTEQAIESLQGILSLEPNHRVALEKLGEAHSEDGEVTEAVEAWSRAAEVAQSEGDADGHALLVDRIRAVDPDSADSLVDLGSSQPEETEPDLNESADDEGEFEIDLDDEVGESEDSFEATHEEPEFEIEIDGGEEEEVLEEAPPPVAAEADDGGFEIEIDGSTDIEDVLRAAEDSVDDESADVADDDDGGIEIDFSSDEGDDISLDEAAEDLGAELGLEDSAAPDPSSDSMTLQTGGGGPSQNGQSISTATAQLVVEDLEEAEFYFNQNLYDEAEAIYQRVLSVSPHHPSASLRLGEIAAARGEDPSQPLQQVSVDEAPSADPASAELSMGDDLADALNDAVEAQEEIDLLAQDGDEIVFDELESSPGEDSATAPVEAASMEAGDEFEIDLDEPAVESESFADEELVVADEPVAEEAPVIAEEPVVAEAPVIAEEPVVAEEPVAEEAPDGDADFDLGDALRESLAEDEAPPPDPEAPPAGHTAGGVESFESVFAEFKKGVSQTISEGDHETRFDLGLAYREMELYDDAMSEFSACLDSDRHRFQSLHMMGICAQALGRGEDAVNHFEQALAMPGVARDEIAGVRFELGKAYAALGDRDRALNHFQEVRVADPRFPGVDEHIAALDDDKPEEDASGYESFDDLLAEANDEPKEAFESFDDVVAGAQEVEAGVPVESVPESPPAATPVESPGDTSGSAPRPKRKKKISFV